VASKNNRFSFISQHWAVLLWLYFLVAMFIPRFTRIVDLQDLIFLTHKNFPNQLWLGIVLVDEPMIDPFKTSANETPSQSALLRWVGCLGCLGYVVLFFTAGILTAYAGLDTLWVLPLIGVYTLVWIGSYFLLSRRKPKP
jgi:hypothetical protein